MRIDIAVAIATNDLNWNLKTEIDGEWAVAIYSLIAFQGCIQDFYNGVSISKKLQEYIWN